jgi:hypothetical protein
MRPIESVLGRLEDPRPNGKERWRCRCPSCGGNRSALSIGVGLNDSVLIRCWKGCDVEEVVTALGLIMSDLFPSDPGASALPLPRRRMLSAHQCVEVISFECLLTWTAALNLANGHVLTSDDLTRLSTAAHRIESLVQEVWS